MTLLDSITRRLVLGLGVASRRLREELALARVETPVTDGCLRELVREADAAAREQSGVAACTYEESLREQLALCASFIQRWTGSDEAIAESQGDSVQQLVRIARKYALPRRWKLSEPVVVEYPRKRPSYWTWTDDLSSDAVTQY